MPSRLGIGKLFVVFPKYFDPCCRLLDNTLVILHFLHNLTFVFQVGTKSTVNNENNKGEPTFVHYNWTKFVTETFKLLIEVNREV